MQVAVKLPLTTFSTSTIYNLNAGQLELENTKNLDSLPVQTKWMFLS